MNRACRHALLLPVLAVVACTEDAVPDGIAAADDTGEQIEEPDWGEGPFSVSGQAWFFDMPDPPDIVELTDVEGAEVYLWEAPEIRATLSAEDDYRYTLEGIPEGAEFAVAIEHPDMVPMLTGVLRADGHLEEVTFQTMSTTIGVLATGLLGADLSDESTCHMATTVSATGAENIWAPGEPDATVSLTPGITEEQGPWYFNTSVLPDKSLSATTTDGGVIVVGAEPGRYTWAGHKDGVDFETIDLLCVGGMLSNAAPPYGMNVVGP